MLGYQIELYIASIPGPFKSCLNWHKNELNLLSFPLCKRKKLVKLTFQKNYVKSIIWEHLVKRKLWSCIFFKLLHSKTQPINSLPKLQKKTKKGEITNLTGQNADHKYPVLNS